MRGWAFATAKNMSAHVVSTQFHHEIGSCKDIDENALLFQVAIERLLKSRRDRLGYDLCIEGNPRNIDMSELDGVDHLSIWIKFYTGPVI